MANNTNTSGSHLLSLETPILASDSPSSRTGPGGDDLSLSELSLSDHTAIMQQPFSLLARLDSDSTPTRNETASTDDSPIADDVANDAITNDDARQETARRKQEKLQSDIFVLKKLNASFELFNETLQVTGFANERIAAQLEQTDALLNKYVNILSKSEAFSRLIFDEQWQGAEADEELLRQQVLETQARKAREAEQAALLAQQEALRLETERQETLKREEKERMEREKSERAIRGGIRGVRGTRASMRGVRGVAPPRTAGPSSSRGIPRKASSVTDRPSTAASGRGSVRPI